jgi:glutamine cyclotransferase
MRMRAPRPTITAFCLAVASLLACADDDPATPGPGPQPVDTTIVEYTYSIVNSYPHDPDAFTEGLEWADSALIESTGYSFPLVSMLRRVDLETGAVVQSREAALKPAPPHLVFAEGVTRVGDRIVQLTWTDGLAFVYDAASFDSIGVFTYAGEGWGLTHDNTRFIMSDGTATLRFRDLITFAELGSVTVRDEHGPVANLNELEYIGNRVFANVFESDLIVMIDPASGRVRGRLDLSGIIFPVPDVANGIAWDAGGGRLFVTGKHWPTLFEIALIALPAP